MCRLLISALLIIVVCSGSHANNSAEKMTVQQSLPKVFKYFGYGSNLLLTRLHINNPSARRIGMGQLNGYRLDFGLNSTRWNGAVATIVPDLEEVVWGSLYDIDMADMKNLDRQEGVPVSYIPLTVTVETDSGEKVPCRTYMLVNNPKEKVDLSKLPAARRPSITYLGVIQRGAVESKLPENYIQFLNAIKHNGKEASKSVVASVSS